MPGGMSKRGDAFATDESRRSLYKPAAPVRYGWLSVTAVCPNPSAWTRRRTIASGISVAT